MEMIDREADGSDSLEVRGISRREWAEVIRPTKRLIGIHDASFHSRWNWLRSRVIPS